MWIVFQINEFDGINRFGLWMLLIIIISISTTNIADIMRDIDSKEFMIIINLS